MSIRYRQAMGLSAIWLAFWATLPALVTMGPARWHAPTDWAVALVFLVWALLSTGVKVVMWQNVFLRGLNITALIAWVGMVVFIGMRYPPEQSFTIVLLEAWLLWWAFVDIWDWSIEPSFWQKD